MALNLHRFPQEQSLLADLKKAANSYILPGYVPAAPFLARNSPIISVGSCFAENIAETLQRVGAHASLLRIEEVGNTPFVLSTQISKIIARQQTHVEFLPVLESASLLIMTVGVALQRFDGNQPDLSSGISSADKWRMFSVEEVVSYISSTIRAVRQVNPKVHIVLTLSPIPLKASPNHPSVFGQDCVSKSVIRVAIENILNSGLNNISYWPAFEIIRWLGGHSGPFFGVGGAKNNRHINPQILDQIMELFVEKYFYPA